MQQRERKPDTLKQRRTRYYVRIILGIYLIYTAYSIVKDMHAGVEADRPMFFYAAAAFFLVVGAAIAVISFRSAMKISAEELKKEEAGAEETVLAEEDKKADTEE